MGKQQQQQQWNRRREEKKEERKEGRREKKERSGRNSVPGKLGDQKVFGRSKTVKTEHRIKGRPSWSPAVHVLGVPSEGHRRTLQKNHDD